MKRICIVGDSHVAALKAGWDEVRVDYGDVALTFFAAPGREIEALAVQDGALAAETGKLRDIFVRTSGGYSRIEPSFDFYILCGMRLSPLRTRLGKNNALDAACAEVEATMHGQVLRKLRECTQAPALMIASPFPVKELDSAKPFWNQIAGTNKGTEKTRLFQRACHRYAAQMGGIFVPQPDETRGETGIDTLARFAKSGVGIGMRDMDDCAHMNAAYGAIVLRAALAALR